MKNNLVFLAMLLAPVICAAQSDRAELFRKASSGDIDAQNELAFQYGHWSSTRYDIAKSNYWYCLAAAQGSEEATVNLGLRVQGEWQSKCPSIISDGNESGFSQYFESGSVIGEIEIDDGAGGEYVVPKERFWRIEWSKKDCPRVCQSDINVNGQIFLDEGKTTASYGEFELNAQ